MDNRREAMLGAVRVLQREGTFAITLTERPEVNLLLERALEAGLKPNDRELEEMMEVLTAFQDGDGHLE